LEQLLLYMPRLLAAAAFLMFEWDFGTVGKASNRFGEIDAVVFHHELENVAAFVTAEAVKDLAMGIYVKTRRFFLMKRAKGDEVCSSALQWKV